MNKKCYLLPNDKSNRIINKKNYFKEYTSISDEADTRVKLIYEQ